jgi:hypothetical protein
MKMYRWLALVAAVLITSFVMLIFTVERTSALQNQINEAAAADMATGARSSGR